MLPSLLKERLLSLHHRQQLPKAILLVNPQGGDVQDLVDYGLARLLCENQEEVCGGATRCQNCRLLQAQTHPDLHLLQSLEDKTAVKIDVVRSLQETLYLPPQIAARRVVFLGDLIYLTVAATNALLKILEEPPSFVFFIGLTQHIQRVLPTLASRFQQWIISPTAEQLYTQEAQTDREEQLCRELESYLQHRLSLTTLAEKWSSHSVHELFNRLYELFAQNVRSMYSKASASKFTIHLSVWQCLMILQTIETAIARILETPSLNGLLMVETWLIEVMQIFKKEKPHEPTKLYIYQ